MADKTNCERLSDLRKSIRSADVNNCQLVTTPFIVIAIHRYLGDPHHVSQIRSDGGHILDIIQLTIADSNHKLRVILTPGLNKLIQINQVQVGSTVVLSKCKLHYDETNLSGSSVITVEDLTVAGHKQLSLTEVEALSWTPDSSAHEQEDRPLTSARVYYVNVWSSMEMWGDLWKTTAAVQDSLGEINPKDICPVKEVAKKWFSIRGTSPTLLVRVLLKSRIVHYAKPSKADKWPFQAYMVVGDKTGACTAVFWNAMCPSFYHTISEGDILLLKRFTVKKSYHTTPRFRPCLGNVEMFDVDLNLNSHHPASEVKHIRESAIEGKVELPSLQYDFITRNQLIDAPDTLICDIVGVVTYVGRFERESMKNKYGEDTGGFWVRKWLHLQDGTSKQKIYVQLYRAAEEQGGLSVRPGQVVMCRHLRVIQLLDLITNSLSPRHRYVTSTAETQVSIVDGAKYRVLESHSAVKNLWQWSRSVACRDAIRESVIGGYHQYPPLPCSQDGVRDRLTDLQILASHEWESVLTNLSYRESRQLLVQAKMVHIKLKDTAARNYRNTTDPSPSKQRKKNAKEVALDPDLFQSNALLTTLGTGVAGEVTIPTGFSQETWEAMKERLDFPPTVVSAGRLGTNDSGTGQPESKMAPYFCITWQGLNSPVLLQSLLFCHSNTAPDTTLVDLLSGQAIIYSYCPVPTTDHPGLADLLSSASQCSNKRFLVALDVYQGDPGDLEIVVNRALPLSPLT